MKSQALKISLYFSDLAFCSPFRAFRPVQTYVYTPSENQEKLPGLDSAHLMIILLVIVSTVWGYGILAVTVISLTSLVGVATIPFFGKKMYKKILATLVALAVGTLAGDSLLHLLPHVWTILLHNIDCVINYCTCLNFLQCKVHCIV